jgi:hypothetical protein
MTTRQDALKVMAVVAACHHRTAPRMDDVDVARATADVWADLFAAYRLELADLIAGVKKRALRVAEAPEPAEIIKFAREIRQERMSREDASRELRGAREDTQDRQLMAKIQRIANQKAISA